MSLTLPRPRQALRVWNTPAVSALDRACAVLGMQPVLEETSLCAEMGGGFHARGRLVEITEWESKFTQWEPRYSVKHGAGQSDPDPAYLDWAGAHLGPEGVPWGRADWLTWAWRGLAGAGQGLAVASPLAQMVLQLPQLSLLLQRHLLPLPPCLPTQVLLQAQAPRSLSDLQLQGQLALQAAQGVLRRERDEAPDSEGGRVWGLGNRWQVAGEEGSVQEAEQEDTEAGMAHRPPAGPGWWGTMGHFLSCSRGLGRQGRLDHSRLLPTGQTVAQPWGPE